MGAGPAAGLAMIRGLAFVNRWATSSADNEPGATSWRSGSVGAQCLQIHTPPGDSVGMDKGRSKVRDGAVG